MYDKSYSYNELEFTEDGQLRMERSLVVDKSIFSLDC